MSGNKRDSFRVGMKTTDDADTFLLIFNNKKSLSEGKRERGEESNGRRRDRGVKTAPAQLMEGRKRSGGQEETHNQLCMHLLISI